MVHVCACGSKCLISDVFDHALLYLLSQGLLTNAEPIDSIILVSQLVPAVPYLHLTSTGIVGERPHLPVIYTGAGILKSDLTAYTEMIDLLRHLSSS